MLTVLQMSEIMQSPLVGLATWFPLAADPWDGHGSGAYVIRTSIYPRMPSGAKAAVQALFNSYP